VKAFKFRLEPARRWRETQVTLQEARVGIAVARLGGIQAQLEGVRDAQRRSVLQIREAPTGETLNAYADFSRRADRQLLELEKQAIDARRALASEMSLLTQAKQRLRLIEELKTTANINWHKEFNREIETFAGETFLGRLQAGRLQSKKRAGA
jgi:hypothetical protein